MESDSIFFQFCPQDHFSKSTFEKNVQLLEKQETNDQKQTLQEFRTLGGLMTLKLRSKVKFDIRIIILHHLQPGF